MQIEFYCDLYISDIWKNKKEKIVEKLKENKLQPRVHVIAFAQGEQNQLEIFSSVLFKQHVFDNSRIFVVGIASDYEDALSIVEEIAGTVYEKTKGLDIRRFLMKRQEDLIKAGYKS